MEQVRARSWHSGWWDSTCHPETAGVGAAGRRRSRAPQRGSWAPLPAGTRGQLHADDNRPAPRTGEAPAQGWVGVRLGGTAKRGFSPHVRVEETDVWDVTLAKSQAAREGQRLDVNPEVTAQAAPSRDPWVEAGPAQPSTARSAPGNWKLKRDGASRSEKRRCRRKGPRPVDLGQLLCSGEREVKRAHRVSCCLQSVTEKRVRDRACLSTAALYTNVETQKLLKTGMKAHEHSCSAKVLPHSQPATGARRPNPTFCRDCQGRGLTWLCMSADRNSNFAL